MKWILLSESYIPNGIEIIKKSFNNDYTYEKFTPTIEFLEEAYGYLNNRLFQGKLPEDIEFKIEHSLEDNDAGHTYANDDKKEGEFVIDCVSLNGTIMMTIHSWLETILHEMIHVMDFKFHPEHFVDARKTGVPYDEHKGWFMEQANKFKNKGFNVEETLKSDWTTSVDDDEIKKKHLNSNSIFIELGFNPVYKASSLLKIDSKIKIDALKKLNDMGYKLVTVLKSNNIHTLRLNDISLDDIGDIEYIGTENFIRKYGPFEKVEDIDLTKMTFNESGKSELRSTMRIIKLPNGGLQYIT